MRSGLVDIRSLSENDRYLAMGGAEHCVWYFANGIRDYLEGLERRSAAFWVQVRGKFPDGFVERLLKRRLLPLYSRPEGFYENDSNLANTLFQAVKYKESMGAWPEGLAALIKDANTPDSLRGVLRMTHLQVILDDLGPGGFGPLALVVRASGR